VARARVRAVARVVYEMTAAHTEEAAGRPRCKTLLISVVLALSCGVVPGIVLLTIYHGHGALDAPCEAPIPYWLFISAIIGFVILALQLVHMILVELCGTLDAKGQKKPPKIANFLACLLVGPLIFSFYWFIQGSIWSFGTAPLNASSTLAYYNVTQPSDLAAAGNIPAGSGCLAGLLNDARTYLIVVYIVTPSMIVLSCCCMCAMVTLAVRNKA